SIRGYIDVILSGHTGRINKTQKEFLEIINKSSSRLIHLVNDLLDISKMESGKLSFEKENINLPEVISEAELTVKNLFSEEKHQLRKKCKKGLLYPGR
ncbi:MAG: hypothetical protein KAS39_06485, partial [Actinomycetia bacterium]|nr:hypothetical protein [Actinomycetes bacterium]